VDPDISLKFSHGNYDLNVRKLVNDINLQLGLELGTWLASLLRLDTCSHGETSEEKCPTSERRTWTGMHQPLIFT